MKRIILSLAFGLIIGISNAQTTVPGGVVSGTWTSSNSPYLVQGAIMIANGTVLTIDPGVRVEFQGDYKFLVLGQLLAIGTINDTITFTATDTTSGWLGIRFDSTLSSNDSSKFFYCKFQYGKANGTSSIITGGALYFNSFSKAVISNSNISNCIANNSGGAICCETSSPLITNNLISNNIADWQGAGIYCRNSHVVISNNVFINNNVIDGVGRGGGVALYECTNPVVDNNTFLNNRAYRGGSVFCSSGSPIITNNINSNNVGSSASCISLEGSNPLISQNSFTNNIGGAVIFCEGNNPTITNNDISNNSSLGINCWGGNEIISNNIIHNNSGGGIFCLYNNSSIISYNFITNNTNQKGGAIRCSDNSTPIISNNVISNNSADSLGGGVYCNNSNPQFLSNTITNNSALFGGALYCTNASDPSFSNTIIWGNTATVSGNQVYLNDETSDPNFSYCDVEGNSASFGIITNAFYLGTYTNNIDSSVLFIAPSAGSGTGFNGLAADWSLMANSPCIDMGNPTGVYPTTDIAGNPRVSNGRINIGAYEGLSTEVASLVDHTYIEVYPNPSNGSFSILYPQTISKGIIEIYSALGERIINQPLTPHSDQKINFTNISQGIYYVKLYDGEKYYCKKVCVEPN